MKLDKEILPKEMIEERLSITEGQKVLIDLVMLKEKKDTFLTDAFNKLLKAHGQEDIGMVIESRRASVKVKFNKDLTLWINKVYLYQAWKVINDGKSIKSIFQGKQK